MKLSKINRIKLAKMLLAFAEVITDKGTLSYEGELAVGAEVFTVDENGELVVAADGDYTSDNQVITVESGKVTAIAEKPADEPEPDPEPEPEPMATDPEPEPEPEPEPAADEPDVDALNARISELEDLLTQRDNTIAELEEQIAQYKEKEGKSLDEPIEDQQFENEKMNNVVRILKHRKSNR